MDHCLPNAGKIITNKTEFLGPSHSCTPVPEFVHMASWVGILMQAFSQFPNHLQSGGTGVFNELVLVLLSLEYNTLKVPTFKMGNYSPVSLFNS